MRKGIQWILLVGISLFFLVSGGLKLVDPAEFGRAILKYQLVGNGIAEALAVFLPCLEIVAGIGLWIRGWRLASLCLIAGMLMIFVVALASAWIRGLDIDCGCLGAALPTSVQFALIRNVVLILVSGWLIQLEREDS